MVYGMRRTPNGSRIIRRVVKRLRARYRPTQVFLFGSYASGRATRHSDDVDLLIVKRTTKPFHQRLFEVRRLVSPALQGRPFDPLVLTPGELTHRLARGDQFLHGIVAEGKLVHGQG